MGNVGHVVEQEFFMLLEPSTFYVQTAIRITMASVGDVMVQANVRSATVLA